MAKKEKKEKKERKGFFKEFKQFISRGNVFDMAIGIIIGGAFTAIVTALCENILKPIINWVLALIVGADGLEGVYTFLRTAYLTDETGKVTEAIDLANSIYIDWGAFINAIINFLLIALVLFLIIKIINKVHQMSKAAKESVEEAAAKRREEREAAEKKASENAEVSAADEKTEDVKETSQAEEEKPKEE